MQTVLIADDSLIIRKIIREVLEKMNLTIVAEARDGLDTINKTIATKPDLIVKDMVKPKKDGLTALKEIMKNSPAKVIVISAYDPKYLNTFFLALNYGAIDFIPKAIPNDNVYNFKEVIQKKILSYLTTSPPKNLSSGQKPLFEKNITNVCNNSIKPDRYVPVKPRQVIIIGASSGGPSVVQQILTELRPPVPPILIVQHLLKGFSSNFARRIDNLVDFTVKEAVHEEPLMMNTVYIAPGEKHLVLTTHEENMHINLLETDRVNGVMPSLDPTIISASQYYGNKLTLVILTGMGFDGLAGARFAKSWGAKIIVQDEASCLIFGMPKAIIEANLADEILEPAKISLYINSMPM